MAVAPSGAEWLVANGIDLIGIDYLSIAPFMDTATTHHILLGNDVIVIEGLDLRAVPAGHYRLLCLPMALQHCDGAPARVVLEDLDFGKTRFLTRFCQATNFRPLSPVTLGLPRLLGISGYETIEVQLGTTSRY